MWNFFLKAFLIAMYPRWMILYYFVGQGGWSQITRKMICQHQRSWCERSICSILPQCWLTARLTTTELTNCAKSYNCWPNEVSRKAVYLVSITNVFNKGFNKVIFMQVVFFYETAFVTKIHQAGRHPIYHRFWQWMTIDIMLYVM